MASLKEMSIREYVSQIDFKKDDWKLSTIKEDKNLELKLFIKKTLC